MDSDVLYMYILQCVCVVSVSWGVYPTNAI